MLTVEQAQQLVFQHSRRRPPEAAPLTSALLGLVLAEDVVSDLDMPPYDKSLVDGFAVRAEDLAGDRELAVVEEIAAGHIPQRSLEPGQTARIMTGAMLPQGAAAVAMLERSRMLDATRVQIADGALRAGQNILSKGREIRQGDTVLSAGTAIRPQEIGLLATVGRRAVKVYRQPVVAILSTGDEVVEPFAMPGPGQIRNSNAPMLTAQVTRAGAKSRYLGIARDRLESLRPLVAEGLKCDVLILSGGVSAGKLDLVPAVLQELGVTPIFHKIAMKPGKPLFFGTKGENLVFGLPGNPVSALVGFELFVRPSLQVLMGRSDAGPKMISARLAMDYAYATDRPTYHPARLESAEEGWRVTPVPWFGSPDLRAISQANAFVLFAAGEKQYRQGELLQVLAPEC